MRALRNWLGITAQFFFGLIAGNIVIGVAHKLFFYHTLFTDPNREFVWHDWGSLAIGTTLGVLWGVSMAIDDYRRRFGKEMIGR